MMPIRQTVPHTRSGLHYALPFAATVAFIGFALQRTAVVDPTGDLAFTRDPTRLIVLGSAYVLASLLVAARPAQSLTMLRRHWVYLWFLLFIALTSLWSAHPAKVIVDTGHFAGFTLVALAAAYHFHDAPLRVFRIVAVAASLVIAISVVVALAYPAIGIHVITGRWQGVTGNPNTLGLLCALSLWAAVSLFVLTPNRSDRLAYLAVAVLAVVGLAGARSTTSIVISAFIVCTVALFGGTAKGSAALRILLAGAYATLLIVVLLAVYALHPDWLTVDSALEAVGKERTLTGRVPIWEKGYALVLMKPWAGWSFDSLASVLSQTRLATGQFHNGYLDLAVRGGIIALLFAGYMIVRLLFTLRAFAKRDFGLAICWLALVLAILLHNLTEASLVRTTHVFWLMFLIAYFSVDYTVRARIAGAPTARRRRRGPGPVSVVPHSANHRHSRNDD